MTRRSQSIATWRGRSGRMTKAAHASMASIASIASPRMRAVLMRGVVCGLLQPLLLLGAASAAHAQDPAAREGWVVLPVSEYRALRTKAFPPDRPPDPPPVEAAISGVDYELTVNGDSASGQARITIDVLKEGWVRIPMPQGLLIREARLDARPVALVDAAGAGAGPAGSGRRRGERRRSQHRADHAVAAALTPRPRPPHPRHRRPHHHARRAANI